MKENKINQLFSIINPKLKMDGKRRNNKSTSNLTVAQSFNERMQYFEMLKREHVLRRKEESNIKELKECTFKPKVATEKSTDRSSNNLKLSPGKFNTSASPIQQSKCRKGYHKRRNITQFLKDQHDYEEKKLKRLEEISKERDKSEEKTFRPKISKKSKLLNNEKEKQIISSVYNRLHEVSKQKCRNKIVSTLDSKSRQSASIYPTKRNYLTEKLHIGDILGKNPRRWKSKENDRK